MAQILCSLVDDKKYVKGLVNKISNFSWFAQVMHAGIKSIPIFGKNMQGISWFKEIQI